MSIPARSKGACWTCRLRRKKCDEERPSCTTCVSLCVSCYGYDPKPSWADGGLRQRAKTEELRCAIKIASSKRRRRTMRQQSNHMSTDEVFNTVNSTAKKHTDPGPHFFPEPENDTGAGVRTDNHTTQMALLETYSPRILSASLVNPGAIPLGRDSFFSPTELQDSQANLLMHYLDHVFPLQFPFYNPSPSDGGRGWLLLILLQTKPLCQAALSLAAYHQATLQCEGKKKCCRKVVEVLEQRHTIALMELRHYLDGFQEEERAKELEGNIEVLACIVLLISLESFMGRTETWRIHLKAASALVLGLQRGCDLSDKAPLSHTYRKALYFFSGVIAWYDILSCATTGSQPWIPVDCLRDNVGRVHLDKIMGCENWAMCLILETARLNEWRYSSQKNGHLSMRDLVGRATRLERQLEQGLGRISESTEDPSNTNTVYSANYVTTTTVNRMITRIFASAALVYLHVIVSGAHPELPEIQKSVSDTIAAFKCLPTFSLMRSLTWPFTITGCMAMAEQRDFFRTSLSGQDEIDPACGNLRSCFRIIEECWRMRQDGKANISCWMTSMNSLDLRLLLV